MVFTEKLNSTFSTLKLLAFLLTLSPFITACSNSSKTTVIKLSPKDQYLVNNPSKEVQSKVNALMPKAIKWYGDVAQSLSHKGRELTQAEKKQAKQLGVKNPDSVRVVILDKFPEPNKNEVNNSHAEGARAMGNIIMLKPHLKDNSTVLCHELVHIAQKDRLGLKGFLKQLALELKVLGYSKSSLENEAYALQQPIL